MKMERGKASGEKLIPFQKYEPLNHQFLTIMETIMVAQTLFIGKPKNLTISKL